jgi:hypothetical protein
VTQQTGRPGQGVGGTSRRAAAWLAWSLAGLSFFLCAASIGLYVASRSVQPPSTWGTGGDSAVLIVALPFLTFPVVGALIASRRPENPIGWICLAAGLFWMLNNVTSVYGLYGLVARPGTLPFPAGIGSLGEWLWIPCLGSLGIYLILLFPDGRLPSARWRPLAWLSGAAIVLACAGSSLMSGRLPDLGGVRNPFGLEGHPWVADATTLILVLLALCVLASVLSLVLRFRRSRGDERAQITWLTFAASVVAGMFFSYVMGGLLVGMDSAQVAGPLWQRLLEDAVTLSFAGVPVAIGIAVLRYRLFDIDLLINRALVYGPLTLLLAATYSGGVVGLQYAFRTLTGQGSTLAVVGSTLAIAALFSPLRRRVQASVDRRFYRRKYDATKTLAAFNARLRDETDLNALSNDVVGVATRTMQPAHVSLWLRPDAEPEARNAAIEQFGHE